MYYVYTYVYMQSKTQQCQIVSLCNMQHSVIYNYMFRPDDGTLTRPKHVVVYYRVLHITQ